MDGVNLCVKVDNSLVFVLGGPFKCSVMLHVTEGTVFTTVGWLLTGLWTIFYTIAQLAIKVLNPWCNKLYLTLTTALR